MTIKEKLVNILRQDARMPVDQIAAMLGVSEAEVNNMMKELEASGIIIGYAAIINEEEFDKNAVSAFIEVRVSPAVNCGYDDIAAEIAQYKEVSSVYLMSGGYDLAVTVKGSNLREVATFVSDRLAPLDGVLSATTHFILHRYKEKDKMFVSETDERSLVSP